MIDIDLIIQCIASQWEVFIMFCAAISGGIMAIYYKIKNHENPKSIIETIKKVKNDPDVVGFVNTIRYLCNKHSEKVKENTNKNVKNEEILDEDSEQRKNLY